MAKNSSRSAGIYQPQEEISYSGWVVFLYLGAGSILMLVAWLGAQFLANLSVQNRLVGATATLSPLVMITVILATLGIYAGLARVGVNFWGLITGKPTWGYRLGFITSCAWALVCWLPRIESGGVFNGFCVASIAGAFGGVLMATAQATGLVENNFPPSEALRAELLGMHRQVRDAWQATPAVKRIFDVCLALAGLLFFSPIWLLAAFLIWLEDPGPLLFVKNSVGKGGVNFRQFKFRSMVYGAEEATGPVLASERDGRVLLSGRFLRKTALDELPQLLNILRGEMSFVGPRPQRTVLVYGYVQTIPEYTERHQVLPGIAGLAQVAGDYYLTPRQKLRFDRLYIRYSSLGFDLKLLFLAGLITFWYRWQPDWDGRLPRWMLHGGLPGKA
jgi:lipopolysaccharide/colanic/teichoic acid biosynthesis glycosyltransferase